MKLPDLAKCFLIGHWPSSARYYVTLFVLHVFFLLVIQR